MQRMITFFFHPKPIPFFSLCWTSVQVTCVYLCGCYLSVINYVIKRAHPGVYICVSFMYVSIYCKCTVCLWACCSMGTYLMAVGLVLDELEAWNALLRARHSDILWMSAVRHSKAIGLTLSQALLSTSAVHIVQPDMACQVRGEDTSKWTYVVMQIIINNN